MSDLTELEQRIAIALPPLDEHARARAASQDWEPDLLDPSDPDERAMLIRLAHPELDEAIADGDEDVTVGGATINPRLHLAIHEIVAQQLIDGEPPEAVATAQRLLARGIDAHEVLHMLGSTAASQVRGALREQPLSHEQHVAALAALPGSWYRMAARDGPRLQRRAGSSRREGRRRR